MQIKCPLKKNGFCVEYVQKNKEVISAKLETTSLNFLHIKGALF